MATCQHCGCDPVQFALAQTEIKGHMRVEDEQRCDLSLSASTITELNRKFAEARERIAELHRDNATLYRKYDQAQAHIAELEKELTWCADHSGECLGDHMQRLNLIRALLKSRA